MAARPPLQDCSRSIVACLYEGIAAPDQWQAGLALLSARIGGQALGITPAAALLAQALATGQTIKEYAATQAVSPETARSHLKNLFRKTGCRRQVELVQLIRTLA